MGRRSGAEAVRSRWTVTLVAVALASGALLAATVSIAGVGDPVLLLLCALWVAWNSWNCGTGKAMFTGSGVLEPGADPTGRYISLALIWVMYVGFLTEQSWRLLSR